MNSYYKFLLVAIVAFVFGIGLSFVNEQYVKNNESKDVIHIKNNSEFQKNKKNSIVLKLKNFVSNFSLHKTQEEIIDDMPYYELKRKIEEFEKKQSELVKEKLDPNDIYSETNPNQSVVNDFVKDFIESKKEWFKKIIYFDKFKKNRVIVFSKVNACKWFYSSEKVRSFENAHCYEQEIFYNIEGKWIYSGRTGGISWYRFYKNKPVIEIKLPDNRNLLNFRIINLYAGLEDNNDEVFGLKFDNETYTWEKFESTDWEDSTELERIRIKNESNNIK